MLKNIALIGIGPLEMFLFAILLVVLWFEISMLIHVAKNPGVTDQVRAVWIIGMVLLHPIVAIAYYFTDYKKYN